MWIGGLIELICGIMVMVGLGTRMAAFVASGEMAVAYVQFHWKFRMGALLLPGINQGELALLYCFVFFYIACYGSGQYSLRR
jgi:putative oxidoreductase